MRDPHLDVPRDWRDRTAVSVTQAGAILGIRRDAAYQAVKRGDLPAIKIGGRLVVSVHTLKSMLGEVERVA